MNNQNLFSILHERGFSNPGAPCLTIHGGRRWTYGEIDALSAQMAGALMATGARPGDRISVQIEKSAENVALYLAALRSGLVYTPLNTAYTKDEIAYFLEDGEPAIFVCDPAQEEALATVAKQTGCNAVLTIDENGDGSLMNAVERSEPFDDCVTRHGDDLAAILYTSGTTGRSKGAMLSHDNLASNATALHQLWGFEAGDVLLHALPIFHVHGLFVAFHTAMLNGSEILFLPKFDVNAIRKTLPGSTVMMGVPTFYSRLLAEEDFTKEECRHMRLFISGSAPLTEETHKGFSARTGHDILERYGMSEAGMITSNPLDGDRIAGTVGYPLWGVDLRIANENGEALPVGEAGAVEIRGPNVFKGYWRMPEKTAEEFTEDGWFKTGDIGALSDDGRLTLVGRAKDLIIAGGYNIYPKEIEAVLDTVSGVSESAVIGVPHPDMGEGVVAVLVAGKNLAASDDALREAMSSLARFKQPRKFIWIDALPRNAMGKVQKQVLRVQYADVFSGG